MLREEALCGLYNSGKGELFEIIKSVNDGIRLWKGNWKWRRK